VNLLFSWLAGLIFGIGLIISGMTNPQKVIGFLDLAGKWDPSLAFVMVGGITVAIIAFFIARKRTLTLLGLPIRIPTQTKIDRRLIIGGLVFGIGWGLAGICPGPALVLLGGGISKGVVFVIPMIIGMGLFEWFERRKTKPQVNNSPNH
jgi:uncharacterized membrane protein YedE/YeeE